MTMTPEEQLNLRARHPDYQRFLDFNESESERARKELSCHLDEAYGTEALQTMDIFPSAVAKSPILVFIHGGYWRGLDKKSYSFVAPPFVQRNMTVAVINYRLIPTVNMEALLQDVFDAVKWIQQHASKYNGNPNAMTVCGHSAGGHLALMTYLMNPDLQPRIQGICSLSGLFDLDPIRNSYLNETLNLDSKDVEEFSASNKDLSVLGCPTLLAVGLDETDLFIKESKNLYAKNKSLPSLSYLGCEKNNHYQIAHQLADATSPLSQFILKIHD